MKQVVVFIIMLGSWVAGGVWAWHAMPQHIEFDERLFAAVVMPLLAVAGATIVFAGITVAVTGLWRLAGWLVEEVGNG